MLEYKENIVIRIREMMDNSTSEDYVEGLKDALQVIREETSNG